MPLPLLVAHARKLPQIDAGEALEAAARSSISFMTDGDRRAQLRTWRDEAGGRHVVRVRTRQGQVGIAATHGIGVRRVKRP
jgi:hypothetical protein